MPRGGFRVGAGRKPKASHLRGLDGGADHRKAPAAPAATAEVDEFDAPNSLTVEQRLVWLDLAPHAFKARTLTKGTMASFILLCANVVLMQRYGGSVLEAGCANHRGLIKLVESGMAAFSIRPIGKPIYEPEEAKKQPEQKKVGYW